MPPSAFHSKNERQRMCVAPASHEAHTRRPSRKRPKNTAFGPCRSKNGSPMLEHLLALAVEAAGPFQQPAPALAADQIADVVAHDRRQRRERDHQLDLQLPWLASDGGGDQRRLARHRHAAGLGHHHQEQQRVADVSTRWLTLTMREHGEARCGCTCRAG